MSLESFEKEKSPLELFKEEIKEIKKKEYDPHFDDINPEELTGEDKIIYEKFKDGSMTFKDFSDYRQNIISDVERRGVEGLTDSRNNFFAWITNQISKSETWMEKFAKEKREK